MTRDELRLRFQRMRRQPDFAKATLPELQRLLRAELSPICSSGRLRQEYLALSELVGLLAVGTLKTTTQSFMVYVYNRLHLCITCGVMRAETIQGQQGLSGDVCRDGVSEAVMEEQITEELGPVVWDRS